MPDNPPFDPETWERLAPLLEKLPEPVKLVIWGDPQLSAAEGEAVTLAESLAGRFANLTYTTRPRRVNYDYYPVIGVMGNGGGEERDYGLRLIGLPAGYQITSLVGGIQAVAFRGTQLEGRARIQLHKVGARLDIEVITSAADDIGPLMATMAFNMAVNRPQVRSFLVMSDFFPQVLDRYSVNNLPHVVLNGRVHVEGLVDEATMMRHVKAALKP